MGRETFLCFALCKHEQKRSVVRWGRNPILDLGKEMDPGAALLVSGTGKMLSCIALGSSGGVCLGFSAWPSLPSGDSGRGVGRVVKPPTDAGGRAGAESAARMQGSSCGVEMPEIIPVSMSKFCKCWLLLQCSKLLQPNYLIHLKSWLRLKVFVF